MVIPSTHVKISQLVASLQTSRQQVVFARLVTSCQQVWNKLLTTCNNLVDIVRLVTRLFQQGCLNHDITILLQPCVVNLVTFLLYHDCIRLVRTTLLQLVCRLVTTCAFLRVYMLNKSWIQPRISEGVHRRLSTREGIPWKPTRLYHD